MLKDPRKIRKTIKVLFIHQLTHQSVVLKKQY